MNSLRFFVNPDHPHCEAIAYTLKIFAQNKKIQLHRVQNINEADLTIGSNSLSDIEVNEDFYSGLRKSAWASNLYFKNECLIRTDSGKPDYLSTAFYMLNSFQEYGNNTHDELGRFSFSNSYQYRFGNVQENLVQYCFDKIGEHPKLAHLQSPPSASLVFLSHDIDSIHGALFQDGFYLLKKGKPHLIFKLLWNELLQRPDWATFDKIMKMEDAYSFKSTFFWLVNRGRLSKREVNADYSIRSPLIQSAIGQAAARGWHNGIHKSISTESFSDEMNKCGFTPIANRNHYLKFNLPAHYNGIEKAGLKMDASVGFAEAYGFRNSYGLPFTPYDLENRKPYSFVEVPLTIMDTTLYRYQKKEATAAAVELVDFLEKNKFNAVISLLWHNNYFTNYKFRGYLTLYKTLLAYFYENHWKSIQPEEIIKNYTL